MIGAAVRKDLLLVLSDRGGLMALFVMPILFMAVLGSVFGGVDNAALTPPVLRPALAHLDGFAVAVPGNAVLFGFFLALTIAIAFLEEKHSGTFLRLRAAPVRRSYLLLAKLVPYFLVGLVQMTFLFGFGALALGLRVAGSWLALAVLSVAVVACATSLGLLIASFSGTQKQVGGVGSIVLLVMGLVGGAMVPRLAMPPAMKTAGLLTPHAWALDGYYDLIMRSGAGLADVAGAIGMLCVFTVVFAGVGSWRFRFE